MTKANVQFPASFPSYFAEERWGLSALRSRGSPNLQSQSVKAWSRNVIDPPSPSAEVMILPFSCGEKSEQNLERLARYLNAP